MSLIVVTQPVEEPVSLDEIRAHLNLDSCSACDAPGGDLLLLGFATAARRHIEKITARAFVTQTLRLTLDCWSDVIRLPVAPVQSIASVKYRDLAGVQQTIATNRYRSDLRGEPARLVPAWGQSWPSLRGEIGDVELEFVAGYGAAAAVPPEAKVAIGQLTAHWFANRENVNVGNIVSDVPWTLDPLLSGLRWSLYQ